MQRFLQRHPSPAPSTLTLYFSYWKPGLRLDLGVNEINVSPHMNVNRLRELVAQMISIKAISLYLYKIPDGSPLPLKDVGTTKISLSDLGQPSPINLSLENVFQSPPAADNLHIVVVSPNNPLIVRYWIRGSRSEVAIKLEVPWRVMVTDLLRAIREKSDCLGGVSPERLELYKFSYSQIEEIVLGAERGHLLPKTEMMGIVFDDVPLNEPACVVVEVVGLRDKHLPDWDIMERASKKPKLAPSNFGPSDYLAAQQNMDTRFIDGRRVIGPRDKLSDGGPPHPDKMLPPLEVLYTGFGEFLDTYRAERESRVGGLAALRYEIEAFAEEMTGVYSEESSRQSKGLMRLNNIMYDSPHPTTVASSIDKVTTDGHSVYGDYKIPCFFVEFKKEEAESKAMPVIQTVLYYQRSINAVKQRYRELIHCSRFPVLGMTIVGPVVTFYAMAWVGSVVYFPLTPGISCVSRATGGDDLCALHGAFIAARNLLARIERDAEKLSKASHPSPLLSHFYPDIAKLPSLDLSISIDFQIIDILHPGLDRILYRAKSRPCDLDLVIKITRSYSIDLHAFCANRGQAPTIRGFKKFPGNIAVVAMDYIEGGYLGQEGSQEFRNKMAEQLKQLVKDFHAAGYVHGDLRPPNIYCTADEIKLLDFDWSGKVGEAFYPPQPLNKALAEGRNMDNLMITQDDDERTLKMTLESIGCF